MRECDARIRHRAYELDHSSDQCQGSAVRTSSRRAGASLARYALLDCGAWDQNSQVAPNRVDLAQHANSLASPMTSGALPLTSGPGSIVARTLEAKIRPASRATPRQVGRWIEYAGGRCCRLRGSASNCVYESIERILQRPSDSVRYTGHGSNLVRVQVDAVCMAKEVSEASELVQVAFE